MPKISIVHFSFIAESVIKVSPTPDKIPHVSAAFLSIILANDAA